jgi:hypothetical protein
VICNLNGIQIQALDYYHSGKIPFQIMSYYDDQIVVPLLRLHFGRWLWDKELALDPKRFKNLQLKIVTDLNGGGSACDAGNLRVFAHVFDEMSISPIGYLQAKEHYTYNLTASAVQQIDLPTDHDIRMLMIQSLAVTKQPYEQYNHIKLTEDNDKKVPIDIATSDLLKFVCSYMEPIVESIQGKATTTPVRHYITPTYETDFGIAGLNNEYSQYFEYAKYGGVADIGSADANKHFSCVVKGYAPHGALGIDLGDRDNLNDLYKVNRLKSLQLKLTAGSSIGSGSTCQVIVQQLRRYGV